MRVEVAAHREEGEHSLPRGIAVPVATPNHRPKTEYRFVARSENDVDRLQRHRLPLHLLTSERVSNLGYPVRFPAQVVVARSFLPLLETGLPSILFSSTAAAMAPRDEDAVVAMLHVDMLGARVLWDRNRARMDATYLLRRILEEEVERRAAFVRFSDSLPGIPPSPDALDPDRLARKLEKHRAPR